MRKLLFQGLIRSPLTEPPPQPDEAEKLLEELLTQIEMKANAVEKP